MATPREIASAFVRIFVRKDTLRADLNEVKQDVASVASEAQKAGDQTANSFQKVGEGIREQTRGARTLVGSITQILGVWSGILSIVGSVLGLFALMARPIQEAKKRAEELRATLQGFRQDSEQANRAVRGFSEAGTGSLAAAKAELKAQIDALQEINKAFEKASADLRKAQELPRERRFDPFDKQQQLRIVPPFEEVEARQAFRQIEQEREKALANIERQLQNIARIEQDIKKEEAAAERDAVNAALNDLDQFLKGLEQDRQRSIEEYERDREQKEREEEKTIAQQIEEIERANEEAHQRRLARIREAKDLELSSVREIEAARASLSATLTRTVTADQRILAGLLAQIRDAQRGPL